MTRLVRFYTLFQFFFGLLLWLPIFYEYQKRMGLSEADIFQIQSLYQIVFCFLEIPTGWFADRFGYLKSIRLGALTLIAANALPIFAVDYTGFLAHFVLIALARSFISGASSAYLYDALKERGQAETYKEIEGSARAYGLIGKVVGWAGVGVMMEWHLTLPYWLTVFASVLALGFGLALPRLTRPQASEGPTPSSTANMFAAFGAIGRSPVLVLLMLQGVAIFVLSRVAQVTMFQPILESKEIPLASHGLVMSAMTLFEAAGSFRPQWARRWLSDRALVTALTLTLAVTMGVIPWLGAGAAIAALCLFSLAVGWSFPVQKQVMNDAIPDSRYRATMLSIESIVHRGISAIATLLMANYMARGAMNEFLVNASLATLVAAVLIAVFVHRRPRAAT